MNSKLRKQNLFDELKLNKHVDTAEYAKRLGISTMTIRRDLKKFAEAGLVTLTHGGAIFNEGAITLKAAFVREQQMTREKDLIGSVCSALIDTGSAIFLDTGSTAMSIAAKLLKRNNIAVITNSLPVMDILSTNKNIQLIALAGNYKSNCKGFFGDITIQTVKKFRIDIAFFGVDAVSLNFGLMSSDSLDYGLKCAVIESARKKYLVTDHTKLGKETLFRICDLKVMDKIILDKPPDEKFALGAKKLGIEIIYPA